MITDKSTERSIILHGTAMLASEAITGVQSEVGLKNPLRTGTWIDAIRFTIPNPDAPPRVAAVANPASSIRVRLHVGRQYLTNGFVPIWLLGRVLDDLREWPFASPPAPPGELAPYQVHVFWSFRTPIYLPPGAYLVPEFQTVRYPDSANPFVLSQSVRIEYLARATTKAPREVTLPWVAAWLPPVVAGGSPPGNVSSTEADLINPHAEALAIDRFIGRLLVASVDPLSSWETTQFVPFVDAYSHLTRIWAEDSAGHILIRDPTPFGALFSTISRTWEIRGAGLRPHGFITAHLDYNYSGLVGANLQPHIALQGRRTVPLRALEG